MMRSAPVPDWIAEVMRDCRSLALTVSTLRLKPSAFLHSCVIGPLSSTSEAGTKSAQRSQWTVVSCARAGARPLARMPARPPACAAMAPDADSFRTLRRAMRAMISSRDCCALELRVACAGTTRHRSHAGARRDVVCQLRVSNCSNAAGAARPERPAGAPGDYATLVENTPIQAKPQPQPSGAGRQAHRQEETRARDGGSCGRGA